MTTHSCDSVLNKSKFFLSLFSSFNLKCEISSADKAQCFACEFYINSTLDSSGVSLPVLQLRNESHLSDMHITPSRLDSRKACGLDGTSAIVLKKCAPEPAPVLAKLYNKCIGASCFPACRKSSPVVLVFKNSVEPSDPSYCQSIRLLPIFGKILESLINSELVKHLILQGLLSDKQYAFHFPRSIADVLMIIAESVYQA